MTQYADFEIWVSPASVEGGTSYTALVVNSPAGSASSTITLDQEDKDWAAELLAVQGIDPDLQRRQEFGRRLFTTLFHGEIESVWNASCGRVDAGQAAGLRLRLWIDAPELARLPWELLYDPHNDSFLALSASSVLARYLRVAEPPLLTEHQRLRILLVVERPPGVPTIDDAEVERLEKAIRAVGPAVDLTIEDTPVVSGVEAALQQQEPHIVHFLGHGGPGKLVFGGPPGGGLDLVDEQRLATLFSGRRSVRLVILTACASAEYKPGHAALFGGVAPALVRARVPAVVAMQYPTVQLDTAAKFSASFYQALASGLEVDAAVNSGRKAIAVGGLLDGRDWSTPVLFLGTRAARLFNLAGSGRPEIEKQWDTIRAQIGEATAAKAALDVLGGELRQLADAHQRLAEVVELNQKLDDLEKAYRIVKRIVVEAQGSGPSLRFEDLEDGWVSLRDTAWMSLTTFRARHPDLKVDTWFPALDEAVREVEANVKIQARRPLAESLVYELGKALARGIAAARADQAEALAATISLSERTVGRLPAA